MTNSRIPRAKGRPRYKIERTTVQTESQSGSFPIHDLSAGL